MTELDEQGRPEPPPAGNETETLVGFLEFQRATLGWKARRLGCRGPGSDGRRLDDDSRRDAQAPGLGGGLLVLRSAARARPAAIWDRGGLEGRPRLGMELGRRGLPRSSSANSGRTPWQRSRTLAAEALADGGLDRLAKRPGRRWAPSLRWILVHMIEEYSRHNGHADLIRESIDGLVGE